MSAGRFEDLVRDARAQKEPGHGRIVAMWAGLEAAKSTPTPPCPFGPDEVELIDGFRRGIDMASRRLAADRRTLQPRPPVRNTHAAYSAPKDEEE